MPAVLESLFPEIDTREAITGNSVVHEDVVCILMPDRDAVFTVVLDPVVLKAAIAHAPAQEKPHLAVIVNAAALHRRVWAACSWVNSIARVAMGFAIEHLDVIGDLKRDAITIVISSHTVADDGILRAIEINGSATAAIDVSIFCFVSIDDEVFKDHTVCFNRAEDGEGVADHSLLFLGIVVPQCHGIDVQQIAFNRLDCAYRQVPPAVEQLVRDADSHSRSKPLGLGYSKLAFTIVAIFGQQTLDPGSLSKDALSRLPANSHARRNEQAVLHCVGARANLESVAGSQRISRFLQDNIICADEISRRCLGDGDDSRFPCPA